MDNPYKTTTSQSYLESVVEQIWLYSKSTGQIFKKITSNEPEDKQMELRTRQTPIILQASSSSTVSYKVEIDDDPSVLGFFDSSRSTLSAKRSLRLTLEYPQDLNSIVFLLNGKAFYPRWDKIADYVGTREFVKSATFVLQAPKQ